MKRRLLRLPPLPPPAHLALGSGATHQGLLVDCAPCAAYHREHPEVLVPSGYEPVVSAVAGEA